MGTRHSGGRSGVKRARLAVVVRASKVTRLDLEVYDVIGNWWGDGVTAKDVLSRIRGAPDASEIHVRINSGGGDAAEGLAIYNLLHQHQAKVIVEIDGVAASAASLIAMAGDEIRMSEGALMMIHNAWSDVAGDHDDMRRVADQLEKTRNALASVYVQRTGLERDRVLEMLDAETWMNAEEAVALGFATSITPAKRIAAMLRSDLSHLLRGPKPHPRIATIIGGSMDPETIKKALEAIKNEDKDAALALLEGMLAEAAGAGAPEGEGEEDPAAMGEGEDEDPPPAPMNEERDDDAPAAMAATARLLRLTSKGTFAGALDEVETWRQSHIKLSTEREKLAKERAAMEAIDRRKLVAELVKLGNEIPATAWKDPQAKTLAPCKRLQDEPLAELRDRVAKLTAARGSKGQRAPQPPPSSTDVEGGQEFQTAHGAFTLSASALAECKRKNLDPAVLAETRAAIAARSNHARTEA